MKAALGVDGLADEQRRSRSEHDFWNEPPAYGADSLPPDPLLEPLRPRPSRQRSILAKSLFAAVLTSMLALLGYALSLELGLRGAAPSSIPAGNP
jgi:hypothetical protein